jgi:lysophospholipase L1-like esterase
MLHEYYNENVTVGNRARGGRTALWFYLEGGVYCIMSMIQPGDYLLIQFGHNDSHPTATFTVNGVTYPYYVDPFTDFKQYLLEYYIIPARDHGAIPVLVTPPPRNSAYCTGGNSLALRAQSMRELGVAENVPVVDLNQKVIDYLMPICPSPTPEDFFYILSSGFVDGTHFQENSARILAGFVADGIEEAGLGLAAYGR